MQVFQHLDSGRIPPTNPRRVFSPHTSHQNCDIDVHTLKHGETVDSGEKCSKCFRVSSFAHDGHAPEPTIAERSPPFLP